MCGRYVLSSPPRRLTEWFDLSEPPPTATPRYNIAPTQPVAAIANDAPRRVQTFRWGLVPPGARDPAVGNRMINARAETLATRPAFRDAYRRRRCLLAADGFYEWRRDPDGGKTPMYVHAADDAPLAFAGLWAEWTAPNGTPLRTCTIVTTAANATMAPVHDRMPVILPRDAFARWLDPHDVRPDDLATLLVPCADDLLVVHPVSPLVNNPRNDVVACTTPVPPSPTTLPLPWSRS